MNIEKQPFGTVLLRDNNDHILVKEYMKAHIPQVIVKFDSYSVETLNVMGIMNAIRDYTILYGYKVTEYGEDNNALDDTMRGYLYERVSD